MQDYEAIVRRLIKEGAETDKVDFKRELPLEQKATKALLAKLVSSLANSESEDLDNYGYIILGAEKGRIVGGIDSLLDDQFSASVVRGINVYLDPPVSLEIRTFFENIAGTFAALIVRPRMAVSGPHFIAKEFNDGSLRVIPGQVYVRVGEEVRLAQRSDFERLYYAKYSLELEKILDARQTPQPIPKVFTRDRSENWSESVHLILPAGSMHKLPKRESVLAQMMRVSIAVGCEGTVPLRNVDVDFSVPNNARAFEVIPKPPRRSTDYLSPALDPETFRKLRRPMDMTWGPDLRNDGATVHYELKEVKHGRICEEFEPFFLHMEDDITELDIPYELYAENLTVPSRGTIHIDISREADDRLLKQHLADLENGD
jgi:Putative DNA-binding domain